MQTSGKLDDRVLFAAVNMSTKWMTKTDSESFCCQRSPIRVICLGRGIVEVEKKYVILLSVSQVYLPF